MNENLNFTNKKGENGTGAGIAIGVLVTILVLIIACCCCCCFGVGGTESFIDEFYKGYYGYSNY